jgi:20S proteasome alpha/beta subunit
MVIMISDRMITTGDMEFEPNAPKIHQLTSSISIMYSGDAHVFAEVHQDLLKEVRRRIEEDPDEWLQVRDVAGMWSRFYTEARMRHAEPNVLGPYGLTRKTLVEKWATIDTGLAEKLMSKMLSYPIPSVEVIIAGVDLRHGYALPTIWQCLDEDTMCADQFSFVSIGTGTRHAEAYLMLANYRWATPNGDALLITYTAKRNAEVAPGVGSDTDIWVIGGNVGQTNVLPDYLVKKLEQEYRKVRSAEDRARQRGRNAVAAFIDQAVEQAAQQISPTNTST